MAHLKRGAGYILVILKVPDPVQPVPPANVHVPEMVLPFAVPVKDRVLPAGVPDFTVRPNVPFTWPPKFPLNVKEPVSVSPDTKHDELVLKLKFLMVSEPSPFTVNDVPKVKTVLLPLSSRVAFQDPFTLAGFALFEPQPTRVRPTTSNAATANCFIRESLGVRSPKGRARLDAEFRDPVVWRRVIPCDSRNPGARELLCGSCKSFILPGNQGPIQKNQQGNPPRLRNQNPGAFFLRAALGFELSQQPLDAVFFFQRGQTVIEVVARDFGLGLADRFGVRYLTLHAIEGCSFRAVTRRHARIAGLADRAGTPGLRDEHVRLGLRFRQLLLQLAERGLQILHLRLLVGYLLREVLAQLAIALDAQKRSSGQVVLLLVDG